MDDDILQIATDAFNSFKPLYPSLSQFLNKVQYEYGKDFLKTNRPFLNVFHQSQEVVQRFANPPLMDALVRKKGYYSKILNFEPFQRVYADTGKIRFFSISKKEETKKVKTKQKKEKKTAELDKNVENKDVDTSDFPSQIGKYMNRGKLTARLRYKDSKGKKYSFEKYIKNDIRASMQFLLDNVYIPYNKLETNEEKDDFLKETKEKFKTMK